MSIAMSEIRERADKVEAILSTSMLAHKMSTCYDWEQGWYGANALEHQLVKPTIHELQKRGYRIECKVNHGVTDYMVYPKIVED